MNMDAREGIKQY